MKILANEFVLPFRDGWQCHASHFLTLDNNEIYCVYFYGSKEGADDVRIYGSRRGTDGAWSEPIAISEDDGVPHWNPVLLRRKDGAVVLFYKIGKPIADWITKYKISYDNCQSWTESVELVEGDRSGGRGPVRNKAIYLSDGSLLAPASTERGEWKCFFDVSCDDGKTWRRSEEVSLSSELLAEYESLDKHGIIQPTIWESESGIHALLRSTENHIYKTDSVNALEWTIPYAINLPNNNSGIDADRLPDGRIVLACNPTKKGKGNRTPMSLYISQDDGNTFEFLTHLTTQKGEYSYPAIRYENGSLHITYTWNRINVQYMCLSDI